MRKVYTPGYGHYYVGTPETLDGNTITWADLHAFLLTPYPHVEDEWGCATCWGVAKWNSFFYAQRVTE